jgi:DNA-directed RNA polymerase subunit H (RpoH/RPB5)
MEKLNYLTVDYALFNINEIDAMYMNSQLDMLLTHKEENKKVYIKYYFSPKTTSKQIRPQTLDTIIEDLYEIENILTKQDTLVIIIDEEPNDAIIEKIKYIYERDGIFVVIHNIKRLQFNILNHILIPKVNILNDSELEELKKNINIKEVKQLPEISRFDPLALAILLRPNQVAKFVRSSSTALFTPYYRVCI